MEQTFTLTDAEIKTAIAEYLTKRTGFKIGEDAVTITIDPGEKGYNAYDSGRAASVKISAKRRDDAKRPDLSTGPG